jgi:hypothetical protein
MTRERGGSGDEENLIRDIGEIPGCLGEGGRRSDEDRLEGEVRIRRQLEQRHADLFRRILA